VKSRLTFNADKTKANLFATLGEGKPSGIILSGHTDTVPWDGAGLEHGPAERAGTGRQALRPWQC
jgi:acetylornithine deacetylase/succinyl-diaminopimelate desuccinylase-like protein